MESNVMKVQKSNSSDGRYSVRLSEVTIVFFWGKKQANDFINLDKKSYEIKYGKNNYKS